MQSFKEIVDEPSKAEDRALEYLEGSKGFEEYMNVPQSGNGMLGIQNANATQLEEMGFQTRKQMQTSLTNKFGGGMGELSNQMSSEIKEWQNKQSELDDVAAAKQTAEQLRRTEGLFFKVNPMRGLPFLKRIEKQYSLDVKQVAADGMEPASINPSVMAGFKHTPKLMYGLGIAASIGLGQNWQNVHFSFQGVGFRSFTAWEWQYGISAYVGFERMYKQAAFQPKKVDQTDVLPETHNTAIYSESMLIGVTKKYNVNKKYSGTIQLLYDIWWQQKGLRSPIVLRFVTNTK